MSEQTPSVDMANKTADTETAGSVDADATDALPKRRFEDLPPAAQRALREAEARRAEIDARQDQLPREVDGRGGLEPTRYEDWEIKGIACDF